MKAIRRIVLISLLALPDLLRPPNLWDVLGLFGVLLLAAGLWLIFPPASFIAAGVLLMAFACLGAISWTKENGRKSLRRR